MSRQLSYLRRDLGRYQRYEYLTEPAVWATVVYRLGKAAKEQPGAALLTPVYVLAHLVVRILSGVDIPRTAQIGPGLRIHHGGPIVMHAGVTLGEDCEIGHGVSIGMREAEGEFPVLGDRVVLSAYAQVFGGVTIGDDTKVGAMSVVITDLPANVTAAGIPAKVLKQR